MAAIAVITRRHARSTETTGACAARSRIERTVILIAAALTIVASPGRALGYRPFVNTDAAVADTGDVEIEFGYIGFRADHAAATILAPEIVINLGVVHNVEAVLQSTLANDVTPRRGEHSPRFEDTEVQLKWVVRDGILQERPGPSIAVEFTVLPPTLRNEDRPGGEIIGILSNTGLGFTYHLNLGPVVEPSVNEPGITWGLILEHPVDWGLRAVAEFNGESIRRSPTDASALVGAIWDVPAPWPLHDLSFDVGVRHGLSRAAADWGGTAGLTFAFPWDLAAAKRP
jgi:hypothetical protein